MESIEKLGDEIATLAAHLDAATHRLLVCVREFDACGGWSEQGALSCAHWLSWRIGLDLGAAREKVRVARALAVLPSIDDALRRGALSYAKVRALTRVARPDNETMLLEAAQSATGAQLERICRGLRRLAIADEESPPVADRCVRRRDLPNGMVKLEIVLHADEAALFLEAVEKARDVLRNSEEDVAPSAGSETCEVPGDVFAGFAGSADSETCEVARDIPAEMSRSESAPTDMGARHDETSGAERTGPTRADGVMALVDRCLANVGESSRGNHRYQVMVHLDQDPVAEDGAMAATLDDGTRISAETFRRIACDAGLVPARLDSSGEVLDIGRRTRTTSPALRRALWVRDRGCRFPSCGNTRFLHGHHIHHWLHGGATSLSNLVLLCPAHHRLIHEGGYFLETGPDGNLVFRQPNMQAVSMVPGTEAVEDAVMALHEAATARGVEIGPDTGLPWWDGVVPDYAWATEMLYTPVKVDRGQNSQSPTSSASTCPSDLLRSVKPAAGVA